MPSGTAPESVLRRCPAVLVRIIALVVRRRRRQVLLVDDRESRVVPALVERHRVLRADAAKHAQTIPWLSFFCARRRSCSGALASMPWRRLGLCPDRRAKRRQARPVAASSARQRRCRRAASHRRRSLSRCSRITAASSRLDGAAFDSAALDDGCLHLRPVPMAVKKPMARVDLIGEAEVAFEPQRQHQLGEIGGLGDCLGELERKEVKPDLRGSPVDVVDVGQQASRSCAARRRHRAV